MFRATCDHVGCTKLVKHVIKLINKTLVALKPYPFPLVKQDTTDNIERDMEIQRLSKPSMTPWSALILYSVGKMKYGTDLFCVNYRCLKWVIDPDAYQCLTSTLWLWAPKFSVF